MDLKRGVLIIVCLVLLSVLSFNAISAEYNANTMINVSTLNAYLQGATVWNVSDVLYFKNTTSYVINFTMEQYFNATAFRISNITIILPTGMQATAANISQPNATEGANVTIGRGGELVSIFLNNSYSTNVTFNINVTINSSDGLKNITFKAQNFSATEETIYNYTLVNKIKVDNTRPTISSTVIMFNETGINLTMSENLNRTASDVSEFNVSYGGTRYDVLNVILGPSNYIMLLLNSKLPTNATPLVSYNRSDVVTTLTDYAGNMIVNQSAVLGTDAVGPKMGNSNITYNYITNVLSLIFSEPVNGATIDPYNLTIASSTGKALIVNVVSSSTSGNMTNITLSALQRDIISSFRVSSLMVNATSGFIKDSSGNNNNGTTYYTLNEYVNDSSIGSIINATFNAATRNLTIIFSETINTSEFNVSQVHLHTGSNYSTSGVKGNLSLLGATFKNNGTVVYGDDSFEIYFNLSDAQMATLGNNSWTSMYVAMSNYTARDLAGNFIARNVSNQTSQYVTFTAETTAPTISEINITPNITKLGNTINISVHAQDFNRVQNVTLNGQKLVSDPDRYIWTGNINISNSSNQAYTVVATDVFGNSVSSTTITVVVDNTAPTTTANISKVSDSSSIDTTGSKWYNGNIIIYFNATGNNVSTIMYKNGTSGDWINLTTTVFTTSANASLTISGNVTGNIIQFRANDTLGNFEAYQQKYIKIDKDVPVVTNISIGSNDVSNNSAASVSFSAIITDYLSGLNLSHNVLVYHNGPTGNNETSPATLTLSNGRFIGTITAPTKVGAYTITVNASDNAGNVGTGSATFNVTNGRENLTISSNYANVTYLANLTTLTFIISNASSVRYNTTHTVAAGVNTTGYPTSLSITFNATSAREFIIDFFIENNATNQNAVRRYSYLSDINAPAATTLSSPVSGLTVNGTTTLIATATDSESGVANITFTIESLTYTDTTAPYTYDWNTLAYTDGRNYSIGITARDYVGNLNTATYYFYVNNKVTTNVTVTNGVADFTGTLFAGNLVQIAGGLNESTQVNVTLSSSQIGSAYGVGTVFISMNITAFSNGVDSAVKFKLLRTTTGLSDNLNSLYAYTTYSNGTQAPTLGVYRDTANDDVDYYAFYFTTTHFSIFTIATAATTTTNAGGGGGGGGLTTKTVDVNLVVSGTDVSLAKNDRAKMISNLGVQYLTATAVGSTDSTITIGSASATMKVGDVTQKDLSGDGKNDLQITLVSISSGKATFNLKKLSSIVAYDSGAPTTQPPTQWPREQGAQTPPQAGQEPGAQAGEQPAANIPATGRTTGSFLSSPILIISLIVILAIIIVGIIIAKTRR